MPQIHLRAESEDYAPVVLESYLPLDEPKWAIEPTIEIANLAAGIAS